MERIRHSGKISGSRHDAGFTLIEMLVALAVLGMATYIAISAFGYSVDLGNHSIFRTAAATLAEEEISNIQRTPDLYRWPTSDELKSGKFALVTLKSAPSNRPSTKIDPPSVMPPYPRFQSREEGFYDKYSWSAYARLPKPDAGYCEVAVVIRWEENNRPKSSTFTTAIPTSQVAASAESPVETKP